MASVDGAISDLSGSDEIFQHTCSPCEDDGVKKEAKYKCLNCDEKLCQACTNYHKKFKATKGHQVVSLVEGTVMTTEKGITLNVSCSCSPNRLVEIYCEDHSEVICSICKTMKHRNCRTNKIHDKISVDTKDRFLSRLEKVAALWNKIDNCKKERECHRQKLENMRENCIKEIEMFRQEINSIFDVLQKSATYDLDEKINYENKVAENDILTFEIALQTLQNDKDMLDNARKADEIAMFAVDAKVSKNLEEYEALFRSIEEIIHRQIPSIRFLRDSKFVSLLNNVSFGTISAAVALQVSQNPQRKPPPPSSSNPPRPLPETIHRRPPSFYPTDPRPRVREVLKIFYD